MARKAFLVLVLATALSLLGREAVAEPTHLMVRAQSLDAKFIGTHTGGVDVVLTNARTGEVLAKGRITGGTGDTAKIMQSPRLRGRPITDPETAGYEAVMDLQAPTLVHVEARGPLAAPAAAITVTSNIWMLPGRDVVGEGLILMFPGLIIEPTIESLSDTELKIRAKVTMMCGCPITPGGLWDAEGYVVTATVLEGDRVSTQSPMIYDGRPSQFASSTLKVSSRRGTVRIEARSKITPNVGVVEIPLVH